MFKLQTDDGSLLHGWVHAPAGAASALVLIVHGLGEHAGRYAHVLRHLQDQGLAVAVYDQRGHGQSGGARGALGSPDSLLADLARVIDHLRGPEGLGALPLVLLGHSMGGLVAARFVAETLAPGPAAWSRPVHALALSSPALDVGMNALQRALAAGLGPLLPNLPLGNGLDPGWVSRDPDVVAAYRADPLVHSRITPRLAQFFLAAAEMVHSRAASWSTPSLLMWAGADRCVRPAGSARFAAAAPADRLSAKCWDGLAHELFNEPEKAQVLAHLDAWLGQQLA